MYTQWIFFWSFKTWWCQPWSIMITGTILLLIVWELLQSRWILLLLSGAILCWWILFLVVIPALYLQSFVKQDT
uniref:DUF6737 domain-containing protein n=1 Tax=Paulinella longichromatophora TaxID=1708747 RepID=A0A2H4ZQA3_9EUKA|nr:hypothetical protein PLO_739 [Paulinella longichromatophora]